MAPATELSRFLARNARLDDVSNVVALSQEVYPDSPPWRDEQLRKHQEVFPEGQLVAVDRGTGEVVGFAASLIVLWNEYDMRATWRDFTAGGWFTNHDPARGRTLYGAEIMVRPALQGQGIGRLLYAARRDLVHRLGLLRIRAGARLRGYHRVAGRMPPEEYVERVVRGELTDPTLSFQLSEGFQVLSVVPGYLRYDPESLGFAAVIEWINAEVATPEDYGHGDPRYRIADRQINS
jgi:ribosomal protein S18 acetylase RimI-like enzyme